ncbi:Arm DNA-binding domain-containing protein [Pseudomonas syringae group genomosp. 3]|uniref:Arm DNA-binding domain-containing protein n=1 Tax=Pseudomonas syringae group genomosp. 3 TaxID=251701 RepID=UPI001F2B87D4|nr:Arm DNA-binding domain-containing protein [Pseudomonas syringae group genomosp. 3]
MRRKVYPDKRKTFETKSDAQAWARMIESEIDRGIFVSRKRLKADFANTLNESVPFSLFRHRRSNG